MKKLQQFLMNAGILCAVQLLMRTVGVGFGVYLSNLAGAEVMGLYSLLSSVYGFFVTFALSGIGLATTRLLSEALGKEPVHLILPTFRKCILYSLCFSGLATVVLFFGAPFFGTVLLGDSRTVFPLRIMSLSLCPMALCTVFSGYFTACRHAYKNGFLSVLEQALRIFAVIKLLALLLPRGLIFACAALSGGQVVASALTLLVSYALFLWDKRKKGYTKDCDDKSFTRRLCATALPVAVSAYARSGLLSLEHLLIPIGLEKNGSSRGAALSSFGTLHSMALPILLFPSALISSFSGLLIPELTECAMQNNHRQIKYICERSMQMALYFSIGVAGVMIFYSEELGQILYPGTDSMIFIRQLAPLVPIMYIDTTVDSMLKGLGEQLYNMKINILDASLSVLLVYLLLPPFGISGYVGVIYLTEIINATLSFYKLQKDSKLSIRINAWVIKPLLAVIGATSLSGILWNCFLPEMNGILLTFCIFGTYFIYLILLYMLGSWSREDMCWLVGIFEIKPRKKQIVNKM